MERRADAKEAPPPPLSDEVDDVDEDVDVVPAPPPVQEEEEEEEAGKVGAVVENVNEQIATKPASEQLAT